MEETAVCRLVKPADLNHHGTLFAGAMAAWLIDACFVSAARLLGRPEDIICIRVRDNDFLKPLRAGDIVDIRARVAHLGSRSITVYATARNAASGDEAVTILTTFIAVDASGKPCPHGMSLPAEYVAANREICELARRAGVGSAKGEPSRDDQSSCG